MNAISAVRSVAASTAAQPRTRAAEPGTGHEAGIASTTVTLSDQGRDLADLPALLLPNSATVRQLATDLARLAGKIFREARIAAAPPVEFKVDSAGKLHVGEGRADKERIEGMLAENPELDRAVRTLNAIGSHAYALETQGHMAFQNEYRASNDPEAVVAKYSYLFSGMLRADMSVVLDGDRVDVMGNGQRWIDSEA